MAYETGVAVSPTQLRDAVQSFAAGLGWTIHRADNDGDPRLFLSEADQFAQLRFRTTEIEYAGALGFSGVADWADQPGYCGWDGDCSPMTYPLTYHLFGGAGYVHCALEVETGLFMHMCFGRLEKHGTYTGGQYVVGIFWNSSSTNIDQPFSSSHAVLWDNRSYNIQSAAGMIYADMPEYLNKWGVFSDSGSSLGAAGWLAEGEQRGFLNFPANSYGPNSFNQLQPLYPVHVFGERVAFRNGNFSPLGQPPDVRYVDMEKYAPGAEIVIGPDTWKVFPIRQKNGPTDQPNSGTFGIAYLKTP